VVFHPWVWALEQEEAVRSDSRKRREEEAWPWKLRVTTMF
jgi:hypothetical protein